MQTAVRHLAALRVYGLLLAVANYSLFTIHSTLLMGCSVDEEQGQTAVPTTMAGLQSYVTGYEEAERSNRAYRVTRGWVPPIDPSSDEDKRYEFFEDKDLPISVFFAREKKEGETDEQYAEGIQEEFFFKSSGKWRVSKGDLAPESYYLYGYIPHDLSINASISKLAGEGKTYADGAVLTLENIPTVTAADLSVIIGAKNGKDDYKADADYSVTGLRRGDFEYAATAAGPPSDGNYAFLLFDHLYSAMRFRMTVQGDYAALRTIKVKELSLQAYKGETPTKKKMDAVITLNATATAGTDPISSIVFTPRGTEETASSFFSSAAGFELGTGWSTFQANFMSDGVTKLVLTSTYDVYDKQGNLIRENCKARNHLNITLFDRQTQTIRGVRYTINLTLNPTYLYVLSEPDLDNPMVVVN